MNVYGKLTILDHKKDDSKSLFQCECGKQKWINFYNVKKGCIKSCGCLKKENMKEIARTRFKGKIPANHKSYVGKKIGFISVIERIDNIKEETKYRVKCDCGSVFEVIFSSLRRSKYKTCKCGYPKHILKNTLCIMRWRCEKESCLSFKWYGKKGIRVCDDWKKFPIHFIEWSLKNGWKKGLTIDRKDSSKDYSPQNCQWITKNENSRKSAEERWARKSLE